VAEVQNRLSSKIDDLEKDLAKEKTTTKIALISLLQCIQQLAIDRGEASPALLARINAKFVEMGGNTTPEENQRLVEATLAMTLDDLMTLLFGGAQPRITEA
jgi:hypothetical protein